MMLLPARDLLDLDLKVRVGWCRNCSDHEGSGTAATISLRRPFS
jgi:hypothetical protein